MKLALDPYMHRHLSLPEICRLTAELGYDGVELSPRADFLDWWVMPRATPERRIEFKKALKDHGLELITLQPMYRWASPVEEERQMAVRYWKRAIEVAVDMGCETMVSEFGRGTSPERSKTLPLGTDTRETKEAAWWRSIEELAPIFEKEGVTLSVEPHPEDWVETFHPAFDIIRMVGSKNVKMSYIAPHTFFYCNGDASKMEAMLREAAPILHHVRVADTYNHVASSGLRYIANPPDASIRVHQHLDIGQGEIDWETFFKTLGDIKFDGIYSSCVFAWEDRAEESSRFMCQEIRKFIKKYSYSTQKGMPWIGSAVS